MDKMVVILDPTISLDEISVKDIETGSNPNYKPDGTETKLSKLAGSLTPFVEINGMKFMYNSISYMELEIGGFLPMITLVIEEKAGLFASKAYPKDGDVVNLYIKSDSPDFKPVRQDYRILDVDSPTSSDSQGEDITYTISAVLNLPDIFVDKIKSFSGMSSFDTLLEMAKELGLGFASNETATDDTMTRICPATSYHDFILNDVLPSTYKDDNSFWNVYIDQYYYLNFVQVNDMLVHNRTMDQVKVNSLMSTDYNRDDTPIDTKMRDLFLSNSKISSGTANHVVGYTPLNNSGNISMRNGYRTYIQYYDKNAEELKQYFVETLNSDDSKDKIILKGRHNEDHTKQLKLINFTQQYDDNVHSNFYHTKLQNKYNSDELDKLSVMVDLEGINSLIYMNQIVPLLIISSATSDVKRMATEGGEGSGEGQDNITIDKFLTGYYMVGSMKYIFGTSIGKFYSKVLLKRREYDIPT